MKPHTVCPPNPAGAVDAPRAHLFAVVGPGRRATDQRCWACNHNMIYRYILWLCIGFAVTEVPFLCRAESNAVLPETVVLQLRRQATALQTSMLDFKQTKVEGKELTRVENYTVDSDGARFTQHVETLSPSTGWTLILDNSFDGSSLFYFGNPQNLEATDGSSRMPNRLMIHSVTDAKSPDYEMLAASFPYLKAAGIYAPEFFHEMAGFSGYESLVLRYIAHGTNAVIHESEDGIEVNVQVPDVVLMSQQGGKPERAVTFLLDPKHGYAIARRDEKTSTGKRIVTIEAHDWGHYVDVDIWLPKTCIAFYYTDPFRQEQFWEQPILIATQQLASVTFERPDITSDLRKVPPYQDSGTVISDRSLPEALTNADHQVMFMVSPSGEQFRLPTVTEAAEAKARMKSGIPSGASNSEGHVTLKRSIWILFILSVFTSVVVLVRQHKVSQKGASKENC